MGSAWEAGGWRKRHSRDPDGDAADIVVERNWRYVGSGYLDADTAARAMTAAALAREHGRVGTGAG